MQKELNLIEGVGGHGAIPLNRVHRWVHRKVNRNKLVRGMGFDWYKGFDVRDTIGSISIKNQGTNSSCSGQAGSYFLEIQRRLQSIKEGALSARSIYAPIAYPSGGTTIPALTSQLAAHGANLESTVASYDINGYPLPDVLMADKSFETPALLTDAENRAGYTPYDISEDIDEVAETIRDYGAVIWEIQGQNGHTPSWTSATPQPPSKDNKNQLFNHFMCAIGAIAITSTERKGLESGIITIDDLKQKYGF
jgi:hypothetical protein